MDRSKWLIAGGVGLAALLLAWLWLRPQAATETAEPPPAASSPAGPKELTLSPEQTKALSLRFAAAAPASAVPVATLPAMVVPPPNARVAVAAQLPGVVTRVFVVEGDMVRAGQTLATVSSRDMVSLGAELSRARARLAVARANAGRIGQLSREGIVASARSEEAQAALRQAEVDVQEQARLIGMANGSASGGGYALSAPISGRISAMTIETGKALDPGAAPFVIDGGGELQVQAQLPERLIGTVQPGMSVQIGTGALGVVLAVGTAIDPQTRSAALTARLPAGVQVRAGQAVSLSVMGPAPAGAVSVPGDAVTQLGGETVVFVQSGRGVVARPVMLAESGNGAAGERVVLSGLRAGERVAISAVSELKALAAAE